MMLKSTVTVSLVLLAAGFADNLYAAADYYAGEITNVSSTESGLLLMLSSPLPSNCQGSPYNWVYIPDNKKTMVALALMTIANKKKVTIYTSGRDATGLCVVSQFDPVE